MDLNQMTRVIGKQRIPCIVVDNETGERSQRHAVDAKEMVAGGRYSWALDVGTIAVPEIKVDANGAPVALIDVPMPPFVPSATLVETVTSAATAATDAAAAKKGKAKAGK